MYYFRNVMMLLLLMFVCMTVRAQRQIEITYTDGTATERLAMSDIGRMWFESASFVMNVGKPATKRTLPMKGIGQIRFLPSATAVKAVEQGGEMAVASVYDLQGRKVLTDVSAADVRSMLRGMPRGIYIVKSKSKTVKMMN